ncbi:MAG: tetratricopeptide repeat protein [Verrucomicrobiota bacterium]|jgi:hypothetical protein
MIKLPRSRNHPCAHYNLGIALAQKGLVDEAIAQFQEVRFKPDDPDAKEWLCALDVPVPE